VGVPVQDEIGPVLGDRDRQAFRAEEDLDPLGLTFERVHCRRVVEQHDAEVAGADLLETVRERLDLGGRLGVDIAEQRLAEVGQRGAEEAADESLRADDSELEAGDLADSEVAVEHLDIRALEDDADLVAAPLVQVVVSEHGEDGDSEPAAGVRENLRLLGLARRRQVAGEQHDVACALDTLECSLEALPRRLGCMNIARCRDPDHDGHVARLPKPETECLQMPQATHEELVAAMKEAAGVLQKAEIPFILGGGLAAWARGGPKSEHDVDLMVRPEDADTALAAFEDGGYRTERPPEGWLYKAWVGDVLVDLIFEPAGGPITDETIERADVLEVVALRIHIASLEDVMTQKLLALTEQEPDYGSVLELARALREQIDWTIVRKRTASSPFAKGFFTLVEELGVVEAAAASS
jgi:hypothetical protein